MQRTAQTNEFSVSQSLVLCLRNAFDITIRQTIDPVPSQRRYYRLEQLDLRFVLQMEWCITHQIRAQIFKTTLQCTEIKYSICSDAIIERVLEAGLVLKTMKCVPAKPDIAKELIEADDIGRKAAADFIDSLLVENLSFTTE